MPTIVHHRPRPRTAPDDALLDLRVALDDALADLRALAPAEPHVWPWHAVLALVDVTDRLAEIARAAVERLERAA